MLKKGWLLMNFKAKQNAESSVKEILKARAEELSKVAEATGLANDRMQVIVFELNKEKHAIEVKYIREVCSLKDITAVPCVPDFVEGIINIRRKIISVINLKKFFSYPEQKMNKEQASPKILVLHSESNEFGILVDNIEGIWSLSQKDIQLSLPSLTGVKQEFFKGVTKEPLVILDGAKIVASPSLIVHHSENL
jgi:purine-binding chemotaxis protein CheW